MSRADLDAFLRKPEPAYHWEKRGVEERDGCRIYDLHVVSQVWQGITWEHRVRIFRPEHLTYPHFCTLLNTGGAGRDRDTETGIRLAKDTGTVYAIVYGIPNQPLYDGRTEDSLVAYTWQRFLETGDESWPLHLPMAKAVLKSMDAIQAFTRDGGFPALTDFLVYGTSKRGWTAWLVGASRDPRVKAIVPMVIDVLNMRKQRDHQLATYGGLSEQVDEYSRAGIPEKLDTRAGRRLIDLEDPYSYRRRLTLPKLVILGTNDRYWTQDALSLYWNGLKGPKWLLYVPNSGHGLEDRARVDATLTAFVRHVARGDGQWPDMHWKFVENADGAELTLESDVPVREARLFHASSETQDFRDAHWSHEPVRATEGFTAHWPAPVRGHAAIFGEVVYEIDGHAFPLSTEIRVVGSSVGEK